MSVAVNYDDVFLKRSSARAPTINLFLITYLIVFVKSFKGKYSMFFYIFLTAQQYFCTIPQTTTVLNCKSTTDKKYRFISKLIMNSYHDF